MSRNVIDVFDVYRDILTSKIDTGDPRFPLYNNPNTSATGILSWKPRTLPFRRSYSEWHPSIDGRTNYVTNTQELGFHLSRYYSDHERRIIERHGDTLESAILAVLDHEFLGTDMPNVSGMPKKRPAPRKACLSFDMYGNHANSLLQILEHQKDFRRVLYGRYEPFLSPLIRATSNELQRMYTLRKRRTT